MTEIRIGERSYRLHSSERHGEWVASAERSDTGDRFGIECSGYSQDEVLARLSRWLSWQHEHVAALAALQAAERAYHRMMAGVAFESADDGSPARMREALSLIERERLELDAGRARNPG